MQANCKAGAVNSALSASSGSAEKSGAIDSATIAANSAAVRPQAHQGEPLRVLRIKEIPDVTPIRNTSNAIAQLYSLAKASA